MQCDVQGQVPGLLSFDVSPQESNHLWPIQIPLYSLKRVQRGPRNEHRNVFIRRRLWLHEQNQGLSQDQRSVVVLGIVYLVQFFARAGEDVGVCLPVRKVVKVGQVKGAVHFHFVLLDEDVRDEIGDVLDDFIEFLGDLPF